MLLTARAPAHYLINVHHSCCSPLMSWRSHFCDLTSPVLHISERNTETLFFLVQCFSMLSSQIKRLRDSYFHSQILWKYSLWKNIPPLLTLISVSPALLALRCWLKTIRRQINEAWTVCTALVSERVPGWVRRSERDRAQEESCMNWFFISS